MSKILINNTASPVTIADVGQTVPASGMLTIQPQDYWLYAASSNVITLISDLAVGPTTNTLTVNDGSFDLSIADGTRLIQHIFPNPVRIREDKRSFDASTGVVIGTTETSITIPAGTIRFDIQASPRVAKLTVAESSGGTASALTSWTIYPGNSWGEDLDGEASLTIYIKSNKINTTLQLVTWTNT